MATVTLAVGVTNPQTTPNIDTVTGPTGDSFTLDFASALNAAIEAGEFLNDGTNNFRIDSIAGDRLSCVVVRAVGTAHVPNDSVTASTDRAATSMTTVDTLAATWCANGDTMLIEQHDEGGTMSTAASSYTDGTISDTGTLTYKAASGESPVVSLTSNGWVLDLNCVAGDTPTYNIGEGIEVIGGITFTNSCGAWRLTEDGGRTATIAKSVIHGFQNSAGVLMAIEIQNTASASNLITNNVIYDITTTATFAIGIRQRGANTDVYHNTVTKCDHTGLYHDASSSACIARNNTIMGCGTDYDDVNPFGTFSHNCDSDGTAVGIPGSSNCVTDTTGDTFTDYAGDDYTLKAGADAVDSGHTGTGVSDDILGVSRDANPDMGAYEYVAPVTGSIGGAGATMWCH